MKLKKFKAPMRLMLKSGKTRKWKIEYSYFYFYLSMIIIQYCFTKQKVPVLKTISNCVRTLHDVFELLNLTFLKICFFEFTLEFGKYIILLFITFINCNESTLAWIC